MENINIAINRPFYHRYCLFPICFRNKETRQIYLYRYVYRSACYFIFHSR